MKKAKRHETKKQRKLKQNGYKNLRQKNWKKSKSNKL